MASLTTNPTRLYSRLRPITSLTISTAPASHLRPGLRLPISTAALQPYSTRTDALPKIARPSFWSSLIPKYFRNRPSSSPSAPKSREWNPASFYIIIFILIGSQAIRMIALKNEYRGYVRSTDAKIRLLREVIEKVQRGEDVDVGRLLGTGDVGVEREWDEVLREIEREDSLWHQKRNGGDEGKFERQTQKQPQEQQAKKDPAVPAVDKSVETTAKDNTAKRKVIFF
ncbi:DUF5321 domain-containing protein [Aspergillus undulatus]|uniref:DUF5321 domain-containing protein n=1 Tax=Aspergillus undulatus TaxID=1810928 RepID=UPI003CCDAFD1